MKTKFWSSSNSYKRERCMFLNPYIISYPSTYKIRNSERAGEDVDVLFISRASGELWADRGVG